MGLKTDDIVFWILALAAIALIIWKLFGSPTDLATFISVALFVIGLEFLLWRKVYSLDKKTSLGFMKAKHDMDNLGKEFNHGFDKISTRLDNIEKLITGKRKK